ncbi:MAG: GyrI-like domain-containing protein [Oscillospiraceae bacterium]|nr:GyrI-like domain-containing protein [Oscillospiraceae bacterium]
MKVEKCTKETFTVIGKEGSTKDGEDFIERLWEDANKNFGEISHLVKSDEEGVPVGVWGAMTDFSRSFKPWENDFSEGLYLAGAECVDGAEAPEGWVKWEIPAFEYLFTESDDDGEIFGEMLKYLEENGYELAGAVHDFTCPRTGLSYMYFPIKAL